MIETLFIVHTETSLNMIFSLDDDDDDNQLNDLAWCRHLEHPATIITGHRTPFESDMLTLL